MLYCFPMADHVEPQAAPALADLDTLIIPESKANIHPHPPHDHEHAHNVILQFPPEPFPPPPLPAQNELRADWTYLAGVRIVVEANLREAVRPEALAGLVWLDGLRRGSAPKAVGAGLANERGRSPSPAGSDGSRSGESTSTGTEVEGVDGPDVVKAPPNFISEIFYLSLAINHIGQQKIVNNIEELARQYDDIRRHLEALEGDQSWRGVRCGHISLFPIY